MAVGGLDPRMLAMMQSEGMRDTMNANPFPPPAFAGMGMSFAGPPGTQGPIPYPQTPLQLSPPPPPSFPTGGGGASYQPPPESAPPRTPAGASPGLPPTSPGMSPMGPGSPFPPMPPPGGGGGGGPMPPMGPGSPSPPMGGATPPGVDPGFAPHPGAGPSGMAPPTTMTMPAPPAPPSRGEQFKDLVLGIGKNVLQSAPGALAMGRGQYGQGAAMLSNNRAQNMQQERQQRMIGQQEKVMQFYQMMADQGVDPTTPDGLRTAIQGAMQFGLPEVAEDLLDRVQSGGLTQYQRRQLENKDQDQSLARDKFEDEKAQVKDDAAAAATDAELEKEGVGFDRGVKLFDRYMTKGGGAGFDSRMQAISEIRALGPSVRSGNRAAIPALMNTMVKLYETEGVVRESDIELIAKSRPYLEQLKGMYDGATDFDEKIVADALELAETFAESNINQQIPRYDRHSERMKRHAPQEDISDWGTDPRSFRMGEAGDDSEDDLEF